MVTLQGQGELAGAGMESLRRGANHTHRGLPPRSRSPNLPLKAAAVSVLREQKHLHPVVEQTRRCV